jgi:hypothetical protein
MPDGAKARTVLQAGVDWQILDSVGGGRTLVAEERLIQKWLADGLIEDGVFQFFEFDNRRLGQMSSGASQLLCPIGDGPAPKNKAEAIAFAIAMRSTREIADSLPLQDAIYVEKISRLLPTYLLGPETPAELVAGFWLTGGIEISASSFRRMRQAMGWLAPTDLKEVIEAAGFAVSEVVPSSRKREATRQLGETGAEAGKPAEDSGGKVFELPGRPVLAAFFNEHVVDIVNHRERYKALGIDFPSAVILHGPPGCGKTFAVERLIDFLGWPSFQVDAASVASPYIHETSKKVAEVFDKAMQNAPSVIVIDEMEAFLADREMGSGHHRVEEMAEFLRRIPEAVQYEVLVIGMTNRIEMIDPAILRRGRFDHVIEVSHASEAEILALVATLLTKLPTAHDVDGRTLARELNGRPLSDVAFVIREGARLAARGGNDRIEQKHLIAALKASPARSGDGDQERRIGFVWS